MLSLNPFFILEYVGESLLETRRINVTLTGASRRDDPTPARGNQLMRATSLILASLAFVHDLRTAQLEPDNFRGIPLDMSQYPKLFGTARIPTREGCRMQIDPESKHVVVMARGQFYWFDVSCFWPFLVRGRITDRCSAMVTAHRRSSTRRIAPP